MTLRPILAICGTTGVGKSKLAIELALAFSNAVHTNNDGTRHPWRGARIINADAMQVYAGMDILTNKVSLDEQCGVDHLLMGFKKPGEQYVVGQWIRDATEAIEETHRRNQLPIVVGGTSYWMQHLVFPGRLVSSFDESDADLHEQTSSAPDEPTVASEQLYQAMAKTPHDLLQLYNNLPDVSPSAGTEPEAAYTLHSLLASLDPAVAARWHWKDTRKVLRSLQIIKQSGRLSSDIIHEQSQTSSEPRYRTLLLWLYARPEVLNPRLDRGLLKEVEELTTIAATQPETVQDAELSPEMDCTLGIYQSIGYREFSRYLNTPDSPERERNYVDAVERMKTATRKYAKRQVRWIRNTLLPVVNAANTATVQSGSLPVVPTYLLDATELDSWNENVRDVAQRITRDFLGEQNLPDPLAVSNVSKEMLSISNKTAE
ncbi:hypothetical protein EUX98_g2418 [Antrodiella citrinella]|uniref:tRNA dimethylallyltransferase n=1 Tax=Antrodiella citrinella TaxID=2447956 RepID=A0A4S4MZ02_9APHY|nr:hypothetical protein EUX98_g2418 [Antrodiella citrinella]